MDSQRHLSLSLSTKAQVYPKKQQLTWLFCERDARDAWQKVRFWDPEHWRFRAEETRTVADQMTHEEAWAIMRALPWTTTVLLSSPSSNSPIRKEERLAIKLRTDCLLRALSARQATDCRTIV